MTIARLSSEGIYLARKIAMIPRSVFAILQYIRVIWFARLIETVQAQNASTECFIESDTFIGNAKSKFQIGLWMARGVCIRQDFTNNTCYPTLLNVLQHLIPLRSAEYNGAAGVLALLPTIGALLGAPTNEIWRLLTIVPFGGALTMALSFGGAILPIKVEDYEPVENRDPNSISSFRVRRKRGRSALDQHEETENLTKDLLRKLRTKLHQRESVSMAKTDLWMGLLGMVLLLIGAQAAMTVVEQGAILPWWCISRWWMHMWYIMVTATAIAENWVQLPFGKQFKLYLSDVPYDVIVSGGEDITRMLRKAGTLEGKKIAEEEATGAAIGLALKQLKTVQAGVVQINSGGTIPTSPRNSILIMVSVIDDGSGKKLNSFLRLVSKSASIAVFVTGTAFFSSAQLLALPMAVMALTLLLSAAVFSRAIASYITAAADRSQPMAHVMVNSLPEANQIIAKIMMLHDHEDVVEEDQLRAVQVEVDGHVFVNCRRVATRSRLYTSVLGILAEPFDLASRVREPLASRYDSSRSTTNGSENFEMRNLQG